MLTIRNEQMKAFRNQREIDFRAQLLKRLRMVQEIALSDNDLADQVERGLASGKRFFSTEEDLANYAEFVLTRMGGWSSADHPAPVLQLLSSRSVPGPRRLSNVELWLTKTRKIHA